VKKISVMPMILIVFLVILSACASTSKQTSGSSSSPTATQAASSPVTTQPSTNAGGNNKDELIAQAKKEGKLVVYGATPEPQLVPVLKKFHELYPFIDTSEYFRAGGSKLYAKVVTELDANQLNADVFASASLDDLVNLKAKNVLMEYKSPEGDAIFANMKDPGWWYAYKISTIPMAYNPQKLPDNEAPKTWQDLLDPKYKGKIGFEDSGSGSQYAEWYALRQVLGDEFFDKLSKQQPKVFNSSGLIAQGLQTGELLIAAQTESFQIYQNGVINGVAIKAINPKEGVAALIGPVGIMKGAKHPASAKLFVDFLLSKEGQQYANSEVLGAYSTRTDVTSPKGMEPYANLKVLVPTDYADLQKQRDVFVKFWTKSFEGK
jgi:iron(III) transport system substrate-binding protein